MKNLLTLVAVLFTAFGATVSAASNTYLDYQNYNHGYCPECSCAPCACQQPNPQPTEQPTPPTTPCSSSQPCNPCDPCAPVCGAECGISMCAIGVGAAAVAVAAALIVTSGSGGGSSHTHS